MVAAVTSTFIIYIQPQLQPDPNIETAGLLRVLLYKMDNTTFGDNVPEVPRWAGPPRATFAVQFLLYLSLVYTLIAVSVAILAKQLLNLYTLAGERGPTIEGTRHPRRGFTTAIHFVVFFLSLLLQSAVGFLGCALSLYLWKINVAIAAVVLISTVCTAGVFSAATVLAIYDLAVSSNGLTFHATALFTKQGVTEFSDTKKPV